MVPLPCPLADCQLTNGHPPPCFVAVKPCSMCLEIRAGQMAPSHNGSRRCKSYSIASGGTRSHCACSVCF